MPVPGSGQLRLRADINQEVNGNDTDTNVSLGTLSDEAGFDTPPDAMSEFYGYSACTAPSVTTNSNSSVSFTSMTANGNVTNDNGCTITERGFYFGTSGSYGSNTKYSVSGTTGAYTRSMTGLSNTTTYYATAYAINSAGETQGSTTSSTTLTPTSYTLTTPGYNETRYFQGPDYMSWAHAIGTASTSGSGSWNTQYNNVDFGWTTMSSASRSLSGTQTSDPGQPTVYQKNAVNNSSASAYTDVRVTLSGSMNTHWSAWYRVTGTDQNLQNLPTTICNNPGRSQSYGYSTSTCPWRTRDGTIWSSCWGPTGTGFYGECFIEYTSMGSNPGGSASFTATSYEAC